jgi:hypothetical protein
MLILRLAVAILSVSALLADQHSVDADTSADFTKYHTFAIRQGTINSNKPELKSPLVRQKIEDSIREQLTAKGLHADPQSPDLIVNFRFGAADKREVESWPTGRWGRGRRTEVNRFTEGTLVIDILERDGKSLLWRGIYTDEEKDAAKLSKKLPDDIKKLFEEYPPKKK